VTAQQAKHLPDNVAITTFCTIRHPINVFGTILSIMKAGLVALLILVSVGLAASVDKRERAPWFCKKRDCPSFKMVRTLSSLRLGAILHFIALAGRRLRQLAQRLREQLPFRGKMSLELPLACLQVREEAEYSLRRYDRTTWAISCAFDGEVPPAGGDQRLQSCSRPTSRSFGIL
jgi:hypothetical protein